jgi:choline-glycine betaine transporter
LYWGLSGWSIYTLVGITLAFFSYSRGLPLTIRSGLAALFGKSLEGIWGHIIDITAVIATVFGISQTVSLGLSSFTSGLYNITGADWLMTNGANSTPTIAALLSALAIVMLFSTISALSGVGRGIKWLSNTNIILSLALLIFFFIFGATWFSLQLLGMQTINYVLALPVISFAVWDADSALGLWQAHKPIFYYAWWIAFAPFVGIFLARISKNRSIREFVVGSIILPSLMAFMWLTFVGGTAIDLELSGVAGGQIYGSELTYQIYSVVNLMLSTDWAQLMSVMIVVLLLTYLITSADSAVLVVNTINSGGNTASNKLHIVVWALIIVAVSATLLLMGGLKASQSAIIIGALPFSLMVTLMGFSLLKALFRDVARAKNSG